MWWDSVSADDGEDEPMLFDSGGDQAKADQFLRAVDDLHQLAPLSPAAVGSPRRLSSSSASSVVGSGVVQVTKARLEDEFCHMLLSHALNLEIEALADLSSLSINSNRSNFASSTDLHAAANDEDDSVSSSISRRSTAYRSLQGIHEIELLPAAAAADLRAIVSHMAAAGYSHECT
ncbi:uncharacterized protein [Miscanthus floridulus]|uniref:uncharacterized protein n=1 Tax=Miscanthus floridulus TaxID=154761 RepID=UPI0034580E82